MPASLLWRGPAPDAVHLDGLRVEASGIEAGTRVGSRCHQAAIVARVPWWKATEPPLRGGPVKDHRGGSAYSAEASEAVDASNTMAAMALITTPNEMLPSDSVPSALNVT